MHLNHHSNTSLETGSVAKSICCSSRRPKFGPKHPDVVLQSHLQLQPQ